jgi:hypothetical protein
MNAFLFILGIALGAYYGASKSASVVEDACKTTHYFSIERTTTYECHKVEHE